jgi:hypothetical protein
LVSVTIDRELEVSKVKDGCDELTSLSDVTFGETGVLQRMLEVLETQGVIVTTVLSRVARPLTEVTITRFVRQVKVLALFDRGAGDEVIEDVEVSLSGRWRRNTVSLEVVIQGLDSGQSTTFGELQFGVFSET